MEHKLKTWPQFFQAIEDGLKPFDVRKNDRGFNAGDVLHLVEYDPRGGHGIEAHKYTGRAMRVNVTYVLSGESFGIKDGFCVMGIKKLEESPGGLLALNIRRSERGHHIVFDIGTHEARLGRMEAVQLLVVLQGLLATLTPGVIAEDERASSALGG